MTTATLLREVSRRFGYFTPIREANGTRVDPQARTISRVVIISEGLGNLRDKNYYTDEAVESAAGVFNGKQFYIDHPSKSEEADRPERSIRDLAGYFSDCEVGSIHDPDTGEALAACFATLHFAESEPGRLAFDQVKTALEYQKKFPSAKDVYAGISINGGGVSHPATIRSMHVNMVTAIQEAFSADIVTKPARGGRFVALMREAAKTAAFKRQQAREARAHVARVGREGGERMAAVVKETDKKDKKSKTTESGKGKFTKLPDATTKKPKTREAGAETADAEAGQGTLSSTVKRLRNAMRAAIDAAADGDPRALIADLQTDVEQLAAMLGSTDEEMPEEMPEEAEGAAGETEGDETAEGEKEAEDEKEAGYRMGEKEAESTERETEGEQEGERETEGDQEREGLATGEGEGEEDDGLGMGNHDDERGGGARMMRYACAHCSEMNNVAPPKGYRLVAATTATESDAIALKDIVTRLRRTLEAKEGRFLKANERVSTLMQENVRLRAENMGMRRLDQARKMLKEAQIPRDILSAKDLLTFEPHQWPTQIKGAKRMLAREAGLLSGGAGAKGANGDGKKTEGSEAIAMFQESYKPASA